ncbi:MAG TPA: multicopper oxidase domain-containing protein, partial [Nocardioidaceae bacterium]|nr:multicopper oxidase domain-containing protein [Nocardioidaceae bacterium]
PFPGSAESSRNGGNQIGKIMQFRVDNTRGWDGDVTTGTKLRAQKVFRLDGLEPDRVRTHSLVELFRADGGVLMATLDNRTFHNHDYRDWKLPGNEPVRQDSLEVWEFANTTMDSHPIHLHLVQFQVLNRQPFDAAGYLAANYPVDPGTGRLEVNTGPYPAPSPRDFLTGAPQPPAPNEMGWKDTVQAPPGMVTRIVVPFGSGAVKGEEIAATSVYSGEYVWHCHILEHEDNDMMQRYVIE